MRKTITPVFTAVCLLCSVLIIMPGCRRQSLYTCTRPMLGTIITITVLAGSEDRAVKASSAAFEAITHVESLMSPKSESGDVFRINRFAGHMPVKVSDETFYVLDRSMEMSAMTDGAFDITFASLGRLWNLTDPKFTPPGKEAVRKLLPLVDYRKVTLDRKTHTVRFLNSSMKIGLGGIAKRYAIDMAMEKLKEHGITDAIVDAGGDVTVSGTKSGEPWRIGLRHPRTGSVALAFAMNDGESVATSGDYERFAMYKGERYHHIIDPKTGFPARTFASLSVISSGPSSVPSVALFVMGKERLLEFLKKHPELKVIVIDLDMKFFASRELKGRIMPLEKVEIEWI